MRASPLVLLFLSGCWPFLPGPFEDYVGSDSDVEVDTTPDTEVDTERDTDPDTDPQGCIDDGNEEDDDFTSGTVVQDGSRISGTICPGDIDVMRLQVDNDCEANITLGFNHAQGDLDLFVYDGNTEVTRSDSQDSDETLTFAGDGITYAVLINGYQGATNDYLMVVDLDCEGDTDTDTDPDTDPDTEPDTDPDTDPPGCIDDSFEDNDTLQTASAPMNDSIVRSAQICANDRDWHAVSSSAGCSVTVNMDYDYSPTTDLEMRLIRPDGGQFGFGGTSSSDDESITAVTPTDTFYIEVYGYQSSEGPYTLDVIEDCSGVCSPDSYEGTNGNNSVGLATPLDLSPVPIDANICQDLDLYRITPDADCTLELDLSFDHTESSDLSLVLRTATGLYLDQSVGSTDTESLVWPTTGVDYIVEVSGADPDDAGDYTLTANQVDCVVINECEEWGEPNDNIDDGYVIDTFPLVNASAELCDANEDDWYTIETTAGCLITVELEFTHSATSDLDLTVLNQDGSVAMEAGSGSSNEFASDYAGSDTLNLRVFGYSSNDVGPYNLSITEDCPVIEDCVEDAFEANNDVFNPAPPAVTLPFNDTLNFCSGAEESDADWFAIEVDEGCIINAVTTTEFGTRLVITDTFNSIHSADDSPPLLDASLLAVNTGTHKVGVFGPTGVGHDYDLSIELDCPVGECVDDEWEENADGVSNDDQATATPITGTQVWDAELCGPDEDWYAIPFESGCKLGVEVSHDKVDTSINAELLNGTSRRGSYVEGLNGTSIVYSPRTTGTVHLRVDSLEEESYSVIVDQYDCPAHECDTDSFEPNGTFDVANPIEFGLPQMASLCEDDVDAWSIDQPDGEVCSTVINVDIAPRATVDLVDADGVVQATFRTTSPIEYIGNDQTLLLSDGAGSEYRIRAEAECGAAPTCPDDDMFAPNWQVEQAPFIQWDVTTRLAICGSADYLHLPMVPAGCTGTVNVFTFGDNSAYGIITDEDGAAVGSMSRISRGSTDSIGETAVPRWVLVQRDSGYGGEYSISTTLECD